MVMTRVTFYHDMQCKMQCNNHYLPVKQGATMWNQVSHLQLWTYVDTIMHVVM